MNKFKIVLIPIAFEYKKYFSMNEEKCKVKIRRNGDYALESLRRKKAPEKRRAKEESDEDSDGLQ